jgi:tRNA-specific 2-thiouridylase
MNDKSQKPVKSIVIGMDGSLDSIIAAYLLKRQGYNCIGLCVVLDDKTSEYFPEWHTYDVNEIKSICDTLEITFYATNVTDLFKDQVLDRIVSSKLSGKHFEILPQRNLIIIETLIEKAKALNADKVATGHYCKVQINQETGAFNLAVTNDYKNDESYGLALLRQEHLSKVIFPLADMRTIEVEKVAKLLSFQIENNREEAKLARRASLYSDMAIKFTEDFSAPALRKTGDMLNYNDKATIGEHLGIYRYHIGQKKLYAKEQTNIDAKLEVINLKPNTALVEIDYPTKLKYTDCQIIKLKTTLNLDMSLPIKAYCKIGPDADKVPVTIFFKNNTSALIIFNEEQEGLLPMGSLLVFYNRSEGSGKMLASGFVRRAGFYHEKKFRTLPQTKEEEEALPSQTPTMNIGDYNF